MVGSLDLTANRIASSYSVSQRALATSLQRISSGKNFSEPKDGVPEFMRVQSLRQERRGYAVVQDDLTRGKHMLRTAEEVGQHVVDKVKRLKELTDEYWQSASDPTAQAVLESEFDGVVVAIQDVIDNAFFNGKDLMQEGTVTTVMMDPDDPTQTIDISYTANDIIDTANLAIDSGADHDATMADVDAEFGKAMSYLAKTSGYLHSVESHSSLIDSAIRNGEAYESSLSKVDDASELSRVVEHEVRQQASLSMLSQANMYRMGVLKLIE
jgi:flagellin